jgi:murein DD-endopeptidase MepM/ murein hydrolase activator NlpD
MKTFMFSTRKLIFILISIVITFVIFLGIGSLATWNFYRKQRRQAAEAIRKYEVLNQELQEIRKSYSDFKSILGVETEELGDGSGRGGPQTQELSDTFSENISLESELDESISDMSSVLTQTAELKYGFQDLSRIIDERASELSRIPSICPVNFKPKSQIWISSRFGRRRSPFTGAWEMHEGLDIPAPLGTPLIATADGTVSKTGRDRFLGNYIEIKHNDEFSTLYGHLNEFVKDVKKGTEVKRGQVIGYMGRTGRTTGCHVHYEVRVNGKQVNPEDYILNMHE